MPRPLVVPTVSLEVAGAFEFFKIVPLLRFLARLFQLTCPFIGVFNPSDKRQILDCRHFFHVRVANLVATVALLQICKNVFVLQRSGFLYQLVFDFVEFVQRYAVPVIAS